MTVIPENYHSELALYDTQRAIERIKHIFLTKLCSTSSGARDRAAGGGSGHRH